MKWHGYSRSIIGGREMNQDAFLVDNENGIFAVADGIGGGLKGEVASQMATEGLKRLATPATKLSDTFRALQKSVFDEAMKQFGEPLMGTTLTAVRLQEALATLCHVGDSRCYLFDGNLLRQLSEDHEMYEESMQGSVLCSYLGLDEKLHEFKIQEESFPISAGQRILLCSDGLYKQLTEMRMIAFIRENLTDPESLLDKLCSEASKAEYSDNITVVWIEID